MPKDTALPALSRLAAFVNEARPEYDAAVRETVRAALVDMMGCMLAGADQPVARRARAALARWGAGPSAVYGSGLRLPAPWAAMANAVAAHALELDDWEIPGNTHPSIVLLPAILAAADGPVSSEAVIDAYVVGFEVIARLGEAMNFEHYDRGWHSTATLGPLGAAAAVARLMRLEPEPTAHALSLAVSQAAGLTCQFGSDAKPLQAGFAAKAGLVAALLAAEGLTGQTRVLDAPTGLNALTGHGDAARFGAPLTRLGAPLALAEHGLVFKPYPSCGYTHRLVDCALEVRGRPGFRMEQVAAIDASLPDFHAAILPFHLPACAAEARFSVPFSIALALARGRFVLADLAGAAWEDPEIRRFMAMTTVTAKTPKNPALNYDADDPDRLAMTLADGSLLRAEVAFPLGAPQNPMSFAQLRAKFDANAQARGWAARPGFAAAAERLMDWDRAENVLEILDPFGGPP